ncbi:reticulon-4-interacting protein 1 homolog, mitochondrial [Agrilus planipennis]|uniref:Reticulon-4-interacting protein 1 homolog, mitochondrial n=1 Tax=Agrilus planipennis TaxID=224129 RepID=A0A7F5R5U9_AGRPL|nr:reticulon-4-interacting protein 1 homolog, mitochondrial [Agrilus planipennis]
MMMMTKIRTRHSLHCTTLSLIVGLSVIMSLKFLIVSAIIAFLISSDNFVKMANSDIESTHRAWVMDSYGQIKDLKLKSISIPVIRDGNEVLVKVSAASVNPIDNLMISKTVFLFFCIKYEILFQYNYCHTSKNTFQILKIPDHLTFTEAASILYTAMTAWSALYPSGKFHNLKYPDTKVLILGASGGVGTQAVQIVKSEGATVVGTCSADAVPLVRSLGADYVFNYRDENYARDVANVGKYDVILDCANYGVDKLPDLWKYAIYIGLDPPVANYTDWYGTIPGLILSVGSYVRTNLSSWMKGHSVQWGFFSPNPQGLTYINKLVEQRKIKPIVQKTFEFIELPKAMEALAGGHLRGKIVVEYP